MNPWSKAYGSGGHLGGDDGGLGEAMQASANREAAETAKGLEARVARLEEENEGLKRVVLDIIRFLKRD